MSLPESLERAASELAGLADQIRPANGDPHQLLETLTSDQAGQLVAWILENEAGSAEELVDAWCEDDEGARILLGVSDEGLAKPSRKLLRRVRHRLRSQGLEVAEPIATPTVRRVAGEQRYEEAHLSSPDFRGARVAYLADSHPSGGARLFEVRFDEGRGILDYKVYNAARSKVRGFLKSLTKGQAGRLFDVDRTALRALVRRAALAQPGDRPLPTAYIEWRGRLFGEDLEKESTPGELAAAEFASSAPPVEDALAAVCGEIAGGGEGPWPPPTSWVSEWMDKAREAVEGLEGEARAAAIGAWIDEVSAALAENSDSILIGRHLGELAWVRWQSGDEEGARQRAAVAASGVSNPDGWLRISRARVDSLFGPFLTELRVVEETIDGAQDEDTEQG